ncbi:MAG: hypothetical protein D6690_13055 [Nitrospirae bacterium]|nr:MAG: hypothetical protein D6690_13055 [Nitrospirota bacterium]
MLAELERTNRMFLSRDPNLQRLQEPVDWSIREVRQGEHTDGYRSKTCQHQAPNRQRHRP